PRRSLLISPYDPKEERFDMPRHHYACAALAAALVLSACDMRVGRLSDAGDAAANSPARSASSTTPAPQGGASVAGATTASQSSLGGGGQAAQLAGQPAQTVALSNGLNAVQVVATARPSVVNITTGVLTQTQSRQAFQEQGAGTGVIFDARG